MSYKSYLKTIIVSSALFISGSLLISAQASTNQSQILSQANNLNPKVLSLALTAYNNAQKQGVSVKKHVLTVIDYSQPSKDQRMYVIDLDHNKLLMNLRVAQGKGTGWMKAEHFSNVPQSKQSSLGLFETEHTYIGKHGLSLRLKGLDQGFNSNAESRAIVVHSAPYVSEDFANKYNRVGNSFGCPAVDKKYSNQLIDTIKDGSLIFSYYPDSNFLSHSQYLHA